MPIQWLWGMHWCFSPAALLIVITTLTACGGGGGSSGDNGGGNTASFSVGGMITGNDQAVTLALNGVEETFTGPDFTFAQTINDGVSYAVQFISTPSNQNCTLQNEGGVIAANVTNVTVSCTAPIVLLQYQDAEVTGNLSSGDYNGDGFSDLVFSIRTLDGHLSGSNQDMLRTAFGNGVGVFTDTVDIFRLGAADTGKRGHILISDDYNADGIDDFAFSSDVLQLFAGNNSNNPSSLFNGPDFIGAPLHSADVDGNGFEDFLSIIFGGSHRSLFSQVRNNGSGSFTAQEFVASIDASEMTALCAGKPLNFTTGDFNGDSLQDILAIVISCDASGIVNDSHNALALFAGNGNGTFNYPIALDVLSDDIFLGGFYFDETFKDMAVGDFDGDGDLDIAITSTTSFLQIMLSDGTGRFTDNGRVTVGQAPVHARAADFNNDSIIDLASIHQDSKNLIISIGNGNGSFTSMPDAIEIRLDPDVDLFDMNVADVDNDGFMDIILAEDGTNPPNTGRGSVQLFLAPAR